MCYNAFITGTRVTAPALEGINAGIVYFARPYVAKGFDNVPAVFPDANINNDLWPRPPRRVPDDMRAQIDRHDAIGKAVQGYAHRYFTSLNCCNQNVSTICSQDFFIRFFFIPAPLIIIPIWSCLPCFFFHPNYYDFGTALYAFTPFQTLAPSLVRDALFGSLER